MKIFIIGLPKSGRTRVAKSLSEEPKLHYVSATDWLQSTFRPPRPNEKREDYDQEYLEFYVNRLKINPNICIDNVSDVMEANPFAVDYIIDGISNPGDLTYLFNYNEDVIVFLNRTDPFPSPKDHEGVAVNVMRDYCLYLATIGLLPKHRWLEYNYKIPGEPSDFIKQLGKHNSVTITKSIDKAIEHLKGELCKLQSTEE